MYKDEIKKIEYFKQKIVNMYLARGEYANESMIESELSSFNERLSVFKYKYIEDHTKLNVEQYNEELCAIYQDLKILYETLYELQVKEFNKRKRMVAQRLAYIGSIAREYYHRSRLETISIFGDTLVYESGDYNYEYKDGFTYIKLNPISTFEGASLVFLVEDENVSSDLFTLELTPTENIKPYTSNGDIHTVSGSPNIKEIPFTINKNLINKTGHVLDHEYNHLEKYKIFHNKGCIMVNNTPMTLAEYYKKEFTDEHVVKFYVHKSTSLKISSTLGYYDSNIQNAPNETDKEIKFYYAKVPAYGHILINTNGTLFSEVSIPIVKENKLIASTLIQSVSDHLLSVTSYDKPKEYKTPVVVYKGNLDLQGLKYIAVKQVQYGE